MQFFTFFFLTAFVAVASAAFPDPLKLADNPAVPSFPDISKLVTPEMISAFQNISSSSGQALPGIAELTEAVEKSRKSIQTDLCENFVGGFTSAFEKIIPGGNPVAAALTIAKTIADANMAIALNCPVINIGERLLDANQKISLAQLQLN